MKASHLTLLFGLALGNASAVRTQESERRPALSEAHLSAARTAIARLGERMANVAYLRAEYAQEQTSLLLVEPIESKGVLRLRADPPCLLLELTEPRPVLVRSDETSHRMYWPEEKRAERWLFRSNELARTLVRCFGPDIDRIEESFEILAWKSGKTTDVIELLPRQKGIERFLVKLRLELRRSDGLLIQVAHSNAEGESVRFTLSRVDLEPDPEQEAPHFVKELPEDVKELVHRVEQR